MTMRTDFNAWLRRLGGLFGVALLATTLGVGLTLVESRLLGTGDPRLAIAAGFRTGALAIDPVEDWRIGPRRSFDCALLQSAIPGEAGIPAMTLQRYADPRNLAEDCEILRDLVVRDPLARYQAGGAPGDIALGHGAIAGLIALLPIPLLRWGIAGLWLAAPLLGFLLARRRPDDATGLLFGPLLAVGCLWLWGPSLSAAFPVALLLVLAGWGGASQGLRLGSMGALMLAALFGAALVLTAYRAPIACCGLATLLACVARRASGRAALQAIAAFALAAILATIAADVVAVLSQGWVPGALAEALLDRLDPASDPIDPVAVQALMVDTLDAALAGPRSVATAAIFAIAFGLLFAPALLRASQRAPMPVGRAYAALAGLAPITLWLVWFGGRFALGLAEGGVIYAWLAAAGATATLHWLGALAWSLGQSLPPLRRQAA